MLVSLGNNSIIHEFPQEKGCRILDHPVNTMLELEPEFMNRAITVDKQLGLPTPLPKLATLVTASAFDAALFDAFGKANGIHAFHGLSSQFLPRDLKDFAKGVRIPGLLKSSLEGHYLDEFVLRQPKAKLPLYHLVGALDPLTDGDVKKRIDDGHSETLVQYIEAEGLTHLKIKLNGTDLDWDVERVLAVGRLAFGIDPDRVWNFSLDFNEKAPNVHYVIDCLAQVKEGHGQTYDAIQYVEQPTARDLEAHPENKMHGATRYKPVVIDESLVGLKSLAFSRKQGYSGVALKACKGISHSVIAAAIAQSADMFLCVQDLTCPSRSYTHSVLLAAFIGPCAAIEANARQYLPDANAGWVDRYPDLFTVKDGRIDPSCLTAHGLGIAD